MNNSAHNLSQHPDSNNSKKNYRKKLTLIITPPEIQAKHKLTRLELGIYEFIRHSVALNFDNKNKDAFFDDRYWVWRESKFLRHQEFGTGKKWSLVSIRRAYKKLESAKLIKIAQNGKTLFGKGHSLMNWFTLADDEYALVTNTTIVEKPDKNNAQPRSNNAQPRSNSEVPSMPPESANDQDFYHNHHYKKNIKNIKIYTSSKKSGGTSLEKTSELVDFDEEKKEIEAHWTKYFPNINHWTDERYLPYEKKNMTALLNKYSVEKIKLAIDRHARFMKLNPERHGYGLKQFMAKAGAFHDKDVQIYFEGNYRAERLDSSNGQGRVGETPHKKIDIARPKEILNTIEPVKVEEITKAPVLSREEQSRKFAELARSLGRCGMPENKPLKSARHATMSLDKEEL